MLTEKENTTACFADRGLCETKTQTFFNIVGDNMVYVTVREFLEFTAETMDYLDIGQPFSSQS